MVNLQRALLVDEKSTTTLGFGVRENTTGKALSCKANTTRPTKRCWMQCAKPNPHERGRILDEREFATNYFKQRIRAHLVPIMIAERPFPIEGRCCVLRCRFDGRLFTRAGDPVF